MRPKGSGLKKTSNFVIKVIERRLRGVAQPGSATVLGTVGREFESRRPDHANKGSDWFHSQSTRRALRKKSSFLAGTRRLASGNLRTASGNLRTASGTRRLGSRSEVLDICVPRPPQGA